jgi:DNA-binding NtrC family response regulator
MLQTYDSSWLWFSESVDRPDGFWGGQGDALYANHSRKIRILVVDDETTITDTLVEILNCEGFEAISASAGEEALDRIHTFGPEVVISDVVMPGMNGVELGVQIRQVLPKCRIILFSGQTVTVDLLKEARRRGYEFEIVAKPVKPQRLLSIIRGGAAQ